MWNIEGLNSDKISDDHFSSLVSNCDIIGFLETWANESNSNLQIPNYEIIASSIRKKHKKAHRNSGGICIYVKCSLIKGIKLIEKKHTDVLWIKLDHSFFKLPKDLYVAFIYISPENTSADVADFESMYAHLLEGIERYSNDGDIMVQGDFNAYTNTKADFVENNNSVHVTFDDVHYKIDNMLPRNNLDHKCTNNSGKLLLELCKETGLRILNGRLKNKVLGKS